MNGNGSVSLYLNLPVDHWRESLHQMRNTFFICYIYQTTSILCLA